MSDYLKKIAFIGIVVLLAFNCRQRENPKETILEGTASVLTDETLLPIMEDQVAVFQSEYDAKITLVPKSENEAINALINGKEQIAILSRMLSPEELKIFQQKKIIPKITKFATDGIVLIRNRKSNDTLIALEDVLEFMRGKPVSGISGLAFDNPNSSTVRHLVDLAGVKSAPAANIYSFSNNSEAIKYIAEHDGMIGVIGLNWIAQTTPTTEPYMDKIAILNVKGKGADYYAPTQNNIAEGKYPLARDLFVVNCQGFSGLGMGFASFVAGERGQRIILKSGLLPARIPGRKIVIRSSINKD